MGSRLPLRNRSALRRGLTLLEVMLALAILGGAIAVVGELMRIGARNAEVARDMTTAQLFCETKMNEMVAGLLPAQAVADVPVDDFETVDAQGEWLYSVTIDQVDQQGLIAVGITVHQHPDVVARPVSFTLTRWMKDPAMAALTTTTSDATSGSTGGSTSAATGGTSGS